MTACQMVRALWRQGWEKWDWEGKAHPRKTSELLYTTLCANSASSQFCLLGRQSEFSNGGKHLPFQRKGTEMGGGSKGTLKDGGCLILSDLLGGPRERPPPFSTNKLQFPHLLGICDYVPSAKHSGCNTD